MALIIVQTENCRLEHYFCRQEEFDIVVQELYLEKNQTTQITLTYRSESGQQNVQDLTRFVADSILQHALFTPWGTCNLNNIKGHASPTINDRNGMYL